MNGVAAATWARGVSARPARVLKVAVLLGLLILVPPFVDSPYVTTVFISALLFGLFGAVYDLMIGYAGLANFGYAGFIAAGAYGSALASFHYGISPPWLGLLIGGACGALLGLLDWSDHAAPARPLSWPDHLVRRRGAAFDHLQYAGLHPRHAGPAVDPFPTVLGIDFARGQLLNYYLPDRARRADRWPCSSWCAPRLGSRSGRSARTS